MAIHITTDCIRCGACEPECPNGAISEGAATYVVSPRLCTECVGFRAEPACQAICPVGCCLPDPKLFETEAELLKRALHLHPHDAQLKARVKDGSFPSRHRT
jgi:ferredoxin